MDFCNTICDPISIPTTLIGKALEIFRVLFFIFREGFFFFVRNISVVSILFC